MDALDYSNSAKFLNAVEPAKTGLEPTTTVEPVKADPTRWNTVTTLLSKGLDLGINIFREKTPEELQSSTPPLVAEPKKIMGLQAPIFYTVIGIGVLLTAVVIIKKRKK
jgi:hypothetical protein